jgi:hypothetical protein
MPEMNAGSEPEPRLDGLEGEALGLFGLGAQPVGSAWRSTGEPGVAPEDTQIPVESVAKGIVSSATEAVIGLKTLSGYTLAGVKFVATDSLQVSDRLIGLVKGLVVKNKPVEDEENPT